MGQLKGKTGNPNGRPKGAVNKTTKTVREFLTNTMIENYKTLLSDLKALTPKERWGIIIDLLPYITPKIDNTAENQTDNEMIFKILDDNNIV